MPAYVAQRELAEDFLGGLEVDFQDVLFLSLASLVAASVHIDGDQRLRFVNDEVAAALEMDLAAEGGLQLARDAEPVEDWLVFAVMANLFRRSLADPGDHVAHPVVRRPAVHHNAL